MNRCGRDHTKALFHWSLFIGAVAFYDVGFAIWLVFIRFGVDKTREDHGQDRNKAYNYTNDENWQ